jgi:hypothetical protein
MHFLIGVFSTIPFYVNTRHRKILHNADIKAQLKNYSTIGAISQEAILSAASTPPLKFHNM